MRFHNKLKELEKDKLYRDEIRAFKARWKQMLQLWEDYGEEIEQFRKEKLAMQQRWKVEIHE